MALEEIVARILADAREQAGRIREQGREAARALLERAEREAAARREELVARGRAELAAAQRERLAGVRLEARRGVLAAKRALVEELFAEAEEKLGTLPAERYAAFLAGLIPPDAAAASARIRHGRLDTERHGAGFPVLLAAAIRRRHSGWDVVVEAAPGEFDAGIQVDSGRLQHDLSLRVLFAEQRERWELLAGQALFAP